MMPVLTRSLHTLGSIARLDVRVERCCKAVHWAFNLRLGTHRTD